MKASTLDKLIWPLIYGGILLLLLGISVTAADPPLGWSLVGIGIALAVIGVLFVYLRSRIED